MKIICPVSTIVSPEEFCQIVCISRHRYERDRHNGKITRNATGGAIFGGDTRFHNTFDVLHYALIIAISEKGLAADINSINDVCENILDRIADILESFNKSVLSTKKKVLEGCTIEPILFSISGKTNEALGVYRYIGETLLKTQSVLEGRFDFRLGMSYALDEQCGEWSSNVWIDPVVAEISQFLGEAT